MATLTSKLIITVVLIFSFTTKAMDEHPFSIEVRKLLLSVEKEDLSNYARKPTHCDFFKKINDLMESLATRSANDLVELWITIAKGGNQEAARIVYCALHYKLSYEKFFKLEQMFPELCGQMESIFPVERIVGGLAISEEADLENHIEKVYQKVLSRANERRFLPETSFKVLSEERINLIQISNDRILMEVIDPINRSKVSEQENSRRRRSSQEEFRNRMARRFPPRQMGENPASNVGQNPL